MEESEKQLTELCRKRPVALAAGIGFSLLSWLVLLGEYRLALSFLGIELDWTAVLVVVTAARLAILLPLPGGVGVLEASQILALSALGFTVAEGAAMGLALLDFLPAGKNVPVRFGHLHRSQIRLLFRDPVIAAFGQNGNRL